QPLPPAQAQYTALDLGEYLKGSDGSPRRGIFFVRAQGWDPQHKRTTSGDDKRFILVTNLGMLVKDNADGSHDVFVMNIDSGRPAADTTVQVLGKNGLPQFKTTTDGEGHARIPSLKGMERERSPVAYVAQRGEDLSFLPFNRDDRQLNLSQFDVGGVYTDSKGDTLNAYLFSDRGLYRPGDTFHVASIIKSNDWKRALAGIPLEMTVTDPRGLTIVRRKLALSASGFETLDYTTEETSPTGEYQVNLYLRKDQHQSSLLGSTTVRVEEFLPDQLTISAHFSRERNEGWVSPEDLQARIDLKNLYGTAASDRRVTAMLSLSPAQPLFRRYKEYRFQDPLQAKHSFEQRLPDATTDDNGEALFELGLNRFEKGSYRLALTAVGYAAEGGRGVTAERTVLVSPLGFLVGFKADGNLGYIERSSRRSVHLLAIDPKLDPLAVGGLQAQLVEQRYVSVLTRQNDGTYRYQSVRKESTLSKKPLELPAKGLNYPLPTDQPGDYVLIVRDGSDTELNRIHFSVVGAANLSRTLEKNAELQIKLNKGDYAAGEQIELQIKAPYTGAGVVTIERDKVYAHQWFKTDTTSSTVSIRVPDDLEGNGYVNVSFVRALDSDEVFTSPLSYGVQPFT
ncbi:MAG TPA: MG2 domain-containing protein, partial [Gammaproteobacteria bacterium]